jgi:hypothetical protein
MFFILLCFPLFIYLFICQKGGMCSLFYILLSLFTEEANFNFYLLFSSSLQSPNILQLVANIFTFLFFNR